MVYSEGKGKRSSRMLDVGINDISNNKESMFAERSDEKKPVDEINDDDLLWKENVKREFEKDKESFIKKQNKKNEEFRKEIVSAYEEKNRELDEVIALLKESVNECRAGMEKNVEELEGAAVILCLEAIYNISGRKNEYREITSSIIKKKLSTVPEDTQPKFSVNTKDYAILREYLDDADMSVIVEDESLSPGSIVMEDALQRVKIGLMDQLENLRSSLLQVVNEGRDT